MADQPKAIEEYTAVLVSWSIWPHGHGYAVREASAVEDFRADLGPYSTIETARNTIKERRAFMVRKIADLIGMPD